MTWAVEAYTRDDYERGLARVHRAGPTAGPVVAVPVAELRRELDPYFAVSVIAVEVAGRGRVHLRRGGGPGYLEAGRITAGSFEIREIWPDGLLIPLYRPTV